MKNVLSLKNIAKKDTLHVGGKGASLGELIKIGASVPPGFVISSAALQTVAKKGHLIEEIETILETININVAHTIENAAARIQSLIKNTSFTEKLEKEIVESFSALNTKYVAVRSSATSEDGHEVSWAGQLHTTLNSNKETLILDIKHCWASFYSPRAIFYRHSHDQESEKDKMAIAIQKMVASTAAGTAFSAHPITKNTNQVLVEAGWGLGEAMASGEITPDSYIVQKDTKEILNTTINNQKKALVRSYGGGNEWLSLSKLKQKKKILSNTQLLKIVHATTAIEKHFKTQIDIEWGIEGNALYILQARPMTAL